MIRLQNIILEMIAKGEALDDTIDHLCTLTEQRLGGITTSVLRLDRQGLLNPLAGPNLPDHYSKALHNLPIGPDVGSCGSAAFLKAEVIVTDIETDPRWTNFKALALPLGFLACWSVPIFDSSGTVVGTFAFYFREKRAPSARERQIVRTCVHLCSIALERDERVRDRERRASTDELTGLLNRSSFNAALTRLSYQTPAAWGLLILDLDNLKVVNDTFGHPAGDHLLRVVAARLTKVVPQRNVYRMGGDEFVLLLTLGRDGPSLSVVARDILKLLAEAASWEGQSIVPSATIGGALLTAADETAEAVRQNADLALYHAKENLKGRYFEYDPALRTRIATRVETIRQVSAALSQHRIEAFYQPIVDLGSRQIVGLEALCRMRTETGEVIAAGQFLEATTDAQVATALTKQMISATAQDFRQWLERGIAPPYVSVNVSSSDFHSGGLTDHLIEAFQGVPHHHVVVEVTESVYMSAEDRSIAREIKALRAAGFRIALDDFGTGFASLTHLLTVPVDLIKIDRSFVRRMSPTKAGSAIINGLLDIASNLNIGVIAEGIEEESQVAHLLQLGCVTGQGYLFHKPMERGALAKILIETGPRERAGAAA